MLGIIKKNFLLKVFALLSVLLSIISFYLKYNFSTNFILSMISVVLLIVVAAIDFQEKEVDWRILIIGVFSGLALHIVNHGIGWSILYSIVVGAIIPFILVYVSRETWMGWGDVLIASWVGLILGYPLVLIAIVFSFFAGALYGIIDLKNSRNETLAFGPYLLVGCLYASLIGEKVINWYLNVL